MQLRNFLNCKCVVPSCHTSSYGHPWRRFAKLPNVLKHQYCEAFGVTVKKHIYVCDRHFTLEDVHWDRLRRVSPFNGYLKEGTVLTRCPELPRYIRRRKYFYQHQRGCENRSTHPEDSDNCPMGYVSEEEVPRRPPVPILRSTAQSQQTRVTEQPNNLPLQSSMLTGITTEEMQNDFPNKALTDPPLTIKNLPESEDILSNTPNQLPADPSTE